MIKVLAIETLQSVVDSRCLSHPRYEPETDKPIKELIRILGNTETHLRDLDQHLVSLMGRGDPEEGPLAGWISYQSRAGFLPDPGDILDDQDFIESCLTKIKNKI